MSEAFIVSALLLLLNIYGEILFRRSKARTSIVSGPKEILRIKNLF